MLRQLQAINDFFVRKNPGHARGDYLVCLAAFDVDFFARQLTVWATDSKWYAKL